MPEHFARGESCSDFDDLTNKDFTLLDCRGDRLEGRDFISLIAKGDAIPSMTLFTIGDVAFIVRGDWEVITGSGW